MSAHLYRQTKLGECLVDALDELVDAGKIPGELALRVMTQFDKSVLDMFDTKVNSKAVLKGKLDVYRYCDNVWTFILSDAELRIAPTPSCARRDETDLKIDQLKMVLVDENVVHRDEGA